MATTHTHDKPLRRLSTQKQLGSTIYLQQPDFPNGVLPTRKVIIENMTYLMLPCSAGQAQRSREDAAHCQMLAELVQEHWLYCNIYTINTGHIRNNILKLYKELLNLVQCRKERRNEKYQERVEIFNDNAMKLFDIFCEDEICRKKLEQLHGVKMTDDEWRYLEDQRSARVGFCDGFVD